jgi:hypothetical protein
VLDLAGQNGLELAPELHLDCDWRPSTRAAFFEFAGALKDRLPEGWELVVTLRLDQYRNHLGTGVPPAHRGVLMAYNMGDVKRPGPGNSIIDPKVASSYLPPAHRYPLPLDLALPIFSWAVVFDEHDRYRGLLSPVPRRLDSPDLFHPVGGEMYVATSPFQTVSGWSIPKGWRLRREDSSQEDLLALAELVRQRLPSPRRVIFYHLDEISSLKKTARELEAIANRLANAPR